MGYERAKVRPKPKPIPGAQSNFGKEAAAIDWFRNLVEKDISDFDFRLLPPRCSASLLLGKKDSDEWVAILVKSRKLMKNRSTYYFSSVHNTPDIGVLFTSHPYKSLLMKKRNEIETHGARNYIYFPSTDLVSSENYPISETLRHWWSTLPRRSRWDGISALYTRKQDVVHSNILYQVAQVVKRCQLTIEHILFTA